MAKLVVDLDVPYWVALPLVLLAAAALNGLIELTIVRRFFDSPRLVLVVATHRRSDSCFLFSLLEDVAARPDGARAGGLPVPFTAAVARRQRHPERRAAADHRLRPAAGRWRWRRSSASRRYGQAIRAAADNPDAARLAGISAKRMSTIVWVIAGVLAASRRSSSRRCARRSRSRRSGRASSSVRWRVADRADHEPAHRLRDGDGDRDRRRTSSSPRRSTAASTTSSCSASSS